VVTGVTILSPGSNSPGNLTITDSSGPGTGATADLLQSASGTLGISGNSTTQMLHRLSDALACKADIILVHGGTNDVNGGATSVTAAKAVVTAAIANLRTIYESLMLAGKRIIAVPITPATTLATPLKTAATISINRWIRAYCRGEAWANPSGFRQIRLADAGVFTEDGTVQTSFAPIGGSGGTAIAMTQDGLHPSQRGAAYYGYAIWQAAQGFLTTQADKYAGIYSSIDGYNSTVNAGGNMMEGLTWQASTVYAPGDMSANGGNVYYVASVAGNATSAGSGGPVGGGSGIVDGNVTWNYGSAPVGRSNFSGGTTGSQTAATGIVYSGLTASGWAITRLSGTASGTVAFTIENPWSNGQVGVRQAVVFTLGSGGQEQWNFAPATLANDHLGLVSGDLGVTAIYAETEIEVSSVVNCTGIVLILSGDSFSSQIGAQTNGVGEHFINSAGEQIGYPTAGRMLLRTQPMIVPVSNTTITPLIRIFFDASGGAGSATMTLKLNYVAIRRAGVA
jgi:lysophospholipase L1-like esterase